MGNRFEQLPKKDTFLAKKRVKRSPTSFIFRRAQIKAQWDAVILPPEGLKSRRLIIPSVGEDVEQLEPMSCWNLHPEASLKPVCGFSWSCTDIYPGIQGFRPCHLHTRHETICPHKHLGTSGQSPVPQRWPAGVYFFKSLRAHEFKHI